MTHTKGHSTNADYSTFGSNTVDAGDYAIKVYYAANSDTAKKAAEVDDRTYRLKITENGRYNSVLISKAELIHHAYDANDGESGLYECNRTGTKKENDVQQRRNYGHKSHDAPAWVRNRRRRTG